jgi:alanyl-tRNA synthetase
MGESYELCGGTHVRATGEIGLFRVVSESSVAAGIRRIEAVSGSAAEELARQDRQRLKTLSQTLKAAPDELPDRIDALLSRQKELEKRLSQAQQASSGDKVGEWLAAAETVSDVTLVAQAAENTDSEALRGLADQLRDRLSSGVAVLGSTEDGKVSFVCVVTDDLVARGLHAGKLVKAIATVAGGGGGGKPHMAQAGGRDPDKLNEALAVASKAVADALKTDLSVLNLTSKRPERV